MGEIEQIKVHKKDNDKLKRLSDITGLPRTGAFGIFSESIPCILNSEIIRNPRSKKKRLKLTFVQEFELPK